MSLIKIVVIIQLIVFVGNIFNNSTWAQPIYECLVFVSIYFVFVIAGKIRNSKFDFYPPIHTKHTKNLNDLQQIFYIYIFLVLFKNWLGSIYNTFNYVSVSWLTKTFQLVCYICYFLWFYSTFLMRSTTCFSFCFFSFLCCDKRFEFDSSIFVPECHGITFLFLITIFVVYLFIFYLLFKLVSDFIFRSEVKSVGKTEVDKTTPKVYCTTGCSNQDNDDDDAKKRKRILIIGAIFGVIIGGVALWYFFGKKNTPPSVNPNTNYRHEDYQPLEDSTPVVEAPPLPAENSCINNNRDLTLPSCSSSSGSTTVETPATKPELKTHEFTWSSVREDDSIWFQQDSNTSVSPSESVLNKNSGTKYTQPRENIRTYSKDWVFDRDAYDKPVQLVKPVILGLPVNARKEMSPVFHPISQDVLNTARKIRWILDELESVDRTVDPKKFCDMHNQIQVLFKLFYSTYKPTREYYQYIAKKSGIFTGGLTKDEFFKLYFIVVYSHKNFPKLHPKDLP